jgi:hypothetical protein
MVILAHTIRAHIARGPTRSELLFIASFCGGFAFGGLQGIVRAPEVALNRETENAAFAGCQNRR